MSYCFASDGFIEHAGLRSHTLLTLQTPHPVVLVSTDPLEKNLATKHSFFCTPICLSGHCEPVSIKSIITEICNITASLGGFYIQTRLSETLERGDSLVEFSKNLLFGCRTVFSIDLALTEEDWIRGMKVDSRSRFRKCQDIDGKSSFKIRWIDFSDTPCNNEIDGISFVYNLVATRRNFKPRYRFTSASWRSLLSDNNWACAIALIRNEVVGFAVVGKCGRSFDYTFASANPALISGSDVSRTITLFTFRQLRSQGYRTTLCLGGGISEGDSLHQYKKRMGTIEERFINIRYASDQVLDYLGVAQLGNYPHTRWP